MSLQILKYITQTNLVFCQNLESQMEKSNLLFLSTTFIFINLYKIEQQTCFKSCRQSTATSLSCTYVIAMKTLLQHCTVLVRPVGNFREVLERPWMTYNLCTELGNCLLLRIFQTPLLCSIFFL